MIHRELGRRTVVAIVLAVALGGCAAASTAVAPDSSSPPTSTPSPSSLGAATQSPSTPSSVGPSASASASAAPLPDGDYASGVITHVMMAAMLKDPTLANDPVVKSILGEFTTTAVFTLRLANPKWTLLVHEDGQDKGAGDGGTYAFVDAHTMVLQNPNCVFTLGFSLKGASLTMTEPKDSCEGADLAVGRVIYASTPWTRKP